MSASREKKTRQEQIGTASNPQSYRAAEERKKEKRSNAMYITIAVVFVLVAVITMVWRSGIVQKRATAATVNGEKYTAAEVSFHFQNAYQGFLNQNYYYLQYLGLDPNKDLREQTQGAEGETWFDYFADQALDQMADIQALNEAAEKDGFEWTDELQAQLDDSVASNKEYAAANGMSFKQYLKRVYGSTMTESVYKEQLHASILAQAYGKAYEDSLSYEDAELDNAYSSDRQSYDVVNYECIRVNGSPASVDADGNPVEVTDDMKAAALAEAKTKADELYASFKNGSAMKSLVPEDSGEELSYTDGSEAPYAPSAEMDWLFDDSRTAGDSAVVADEEGGAYYVVSFTSRYRQEYNTVNVRHILIQPEAGELKEGDEGYAEEQTKLKEAAKAKADEVLAQWQDGEATEESFAELAKTNSADSNAADGGLYTQVTKGTMVPSFNDWIFDEARKTGDTGIVETDYGYHVMYFSGTDIPAWKLQVTQHLKSDAFEAWYAEKTEGFEAKAGSGMKYVG